LVLEIRCIASRRRWSSGAFCFAGISLVEVVAQVEANFVALVSALDSAHDCIENHFFST